MAIVRGFFGADGKNKYLKTEIDVTWFKMLNLTQSDVAVGGADQIIRAQWQKGMLYGTAVRKDGTNDAMESINLTAANAITQIDTSQDPKGTPETYVGITNAAPPVVEVADALLYPDHSTVRVQSATGSTTLAAMEYTVVANDATHFDLAYMVAPGSAATGGVLYPLKWEGPWAPRTRYIASITQAQEAVIQMTVTNEFEVGDVVMLTVPEEYGMLEADKKEVKVLSIETDIATNVNTITVDLNTTTFTAFAWPATGTELNEMAQVIPVTPADMNTAFTGIRIVTGATAPGGVADDVIFWRAGDSDIIED